MKTTSYGKSQRLNSSLMLCLCLVLVCLITVGATGYSANGKAPNIKKFEADKLVLDDGSFAMYEFVVSGATYIRLVEAGNILKEVNNPDAHTLKGTVPGNPTYAIRAGDNSNTFEAVLYARNDFGEVEKRLTLSFATELPPQPASLIPPVSMSNRPETPDWGDQYSSPTSTQPQSPTTHNEPEFFECPTSCPYCLTPAEAKSEGFTQRCSDELCYYSPDMTQKWYCYSEPEGWCCVGGHGGQVNQATKSQCTQVGGEWYADQSLAQQACQPMCWCCRRDGAVGYVTINECRLVGNCYDNQYQAQQVCQQMTSCWCCVNGQVGQVSQTQCLQMGGCCHNTQAEALRECQQTPPPAPYPDYYDGQRY